MSYAMLHCALRHAAMAILPILAEAANRFSKANSKRRYSFEALLSAIRKLAVVFAAHFGQQQLGVAKNSSEWIVQFMAERFAESFLTVCVSQRRCSERLFV